ncbi:restriction endonuclease [candidate division GN15 bacterium]|uniref:Restriction endonuclease n=1 Tax=candidate division GN15 bacterium TaxID=2072418 RepID=A0A855X3Q6_9BACT|nr:MAG: restriction endonuclease [candidate division GN15 bacterium]
MRIAARYSFNDGITAVSSKYPRLLTEIERVIELVDASAHKTKKSKEKTMRGTILYSPRRLNKSFKKEFQRLKWTTQRVKCDYSLDHYVGGYTPTALNKGAFREMDFIKDKLGVEVQFGKYAFMVYNVSAKMTIFSNLGFIDAGVEIVPVKAFANEMSSGVSYFEQFVWDLDNRGVSNIDIPVLILGIDA